MDNCKFDLQRFIEGWNYDLYKQLGAHPTTHNNQKGYLFRVYAPNAVKVAVVGNFNKYNDKKNLCHKLEHGIWETFIPGVEKENHYKFVIFTHDGQRLEKADPFAFFSEPSPYFNSIVYDLNNYKWNDAEWMEHCKTKNYKSEPILIYEVHLGSWRKGLNDTGGDESLCFLHYKDFVQQLIPYLKKHNFNYVEFLPLLEHPFIGSWGYQVTGFFSPTWRYGKPEELKYFIDQLHQNGIGVILDFVPVHFCKDDHGLREFDGSHLYSFDIELDRENVLWGTSNFNLGKHEVQSFLLSSIFYWIKEFHIDGYRIDAVSYMIYHGGSVKRGLNHPSINFLKGLNSHVQKHFPHVLKIAEDSSAYHRVTGPVADSCLGFDLKWDLGFSNDLFKFVKMDFMHRKHDSFQNITFSLSYKDNENYLLPLSHDEVVHLKNSFLKKNYGSEFEKFAGLRLMLGYQITRPGKKLVFMGTEFGHWEEWNEKHSLDWEVFDNFFNQSISVYSCKLNEVYLKEKALWELDYEHKGFKWNQVNNGQNILIFERYGNNPDDVLICIQNFSNQYFPEYVLKVPFNLQYEEIINSDCKEFGGAGFINVTPVSSENHGGEMYIRIKLAPLSVIILKPIRQKGKLHVRE